MIELDPQAVLRRFSLLARLDESEAAKYLPLAELAISEIAPRIRTAPNGEAEAAVSGGLARLEHLCAALCCYRYALLTDGGEETVRALNVSVSSKSGGLRQSAKELRDDALRMARPLLNDDTFYFERTAVL